MIDIGMMGRRSYVYGRLYSYDGMNGLDYCNLGLTIRQLLYGTEHVNSHAIPVHGC